MNGKHPLPLLMLALVLFGMGRPAAAYIGPGSGLMAIGIFLAVVAGIAVALIGFLWYPIKRILGNSRGDAADGAGDRETE